MGEAFFDSNVPLYLLSDDLAKAERAESLLRIGGVASVQVLNEVANVVRRRHALDWRELHELLATLRGLLRIVPVTLAVHDRGLAIAERHRLGLRDAMIVAAAAEADCTTLYTEDLNAGERIEGVEIVNPFN